MEAAKAYLETVWGDAARRFTMTAETPASDGAAAPALPHDISAPLS
jgi:hypothetical protein